MSTWTARKPEKRQISAARKIAMEKEMAKPVKSVFLALEGHAAVKREMAVWREPAHRERQIP